MPSTSCRAADESPHAWQRQPSPILSKSCLITCTPYLPPLTVLDQSAHYAFEKAAAIRVRRLLERGQVLGNNHGAPAVPRFGQQPCPQKS
eukprot:scaffold284300_cov30-Tisochrysis_lutea.AAC.6